MKKEEKEITDKKYYVGYYYQNTGLLPGNE